MSYILHLDSQATGLRYRARPEKFTLGNLQLGLDISKNYEIALVSASMWYSWYNISDSQYSNASWRYSIDSGATWIAHTVPDGLYSIDSLNSYFQKTVTEDGNKKPGSPRWRTSLNFQVLLVSRPCKVSFFHLYFGRWARYWEYFAYSF